VGLALILPARPLRVEKQVSFQQFAPTFDAAVEVAKIVGLAVREEPVAESLIFGAEWSKSCRGS
jgi:hypothetical protein